MMMRAVLFAGAAVLCVIAPSVSAADLAVSRAPKATAAREAGATEAACLRWDRQTQSWFNYCDAIPDEGRNYYHYWW
jgi:hypothetical protein